MSELTLCDCFARDGLRHEPAFVPTATKRALIERFAALGFRRIETTSYSNPKVVPQFADASELLRALPPAQTQTPLDKAQGCQALPAGLSSGSTILESEAL